MRFSLLRVFIVVGVALFIVSCKKETTKPVLWPSTSFAGSFAGNESCALTGSGANNIAITAASATQVSIYNLYGSGRSFNGVVSHDTCTILPQVYNSGGGNALMQGQLVLTSDTLTLNIIISAFSSENTCHAVLVKQ